MKNNILPRLVKIFIWEHRYYFKEKDKNHKKYFKKIFFDNRKKSLSIDKVKNWIRKLNKLTYSLPELIEVGEAFFSSNIKVLQDREVYPADIIAICVEKNDILKLKRFISHHRLLGIDKFVILDNDSNDGTIEWLLEQKDVILLQTKIPYTTYRRVGWINRIIAHYGYNRWYFVADSDELLVYNDCENKTIKDLIDYCNRKNIKRVKAIMIDMYAKPEYYINGKYENYYNECRYFDVDTYCFSKGKFFENIYGGPRKRVFNFKACLIKYPLFYFRKNDIFRSHFLYPYKENFNKDCQIALKHYKFLPGEIKKYKKIAKEGNYFNNSIEYKKYLEVMKEKNKLDFMYENTEEYKDSKSLNKITIYKKIDW